MMFRNFLIMCLLFWTGVTQGGELPKWEVKTTESSEASPSVQMIVYEDAEMKKQLFVFDAETTLARIDRVKILKLKGYERPLLYTEWVQGMHATWIRVFDIDSSAAKKLLYQESPDALDSVEFKTDSIVFHYIINQRPQTVTWSPGK